MRYASGGGGRGVGEGVCALLIAVRISRRAHAVSEETGEKREKRRREYPTADDIIGTLWLSRVILLVEELLFISLSLSLSASLIFSTSAVR